jgi:conjugal transfer/type IV secretion protein DotA/TraY
VDKLLPHLRRMTYWVLVIMALAVSAQAQSSMTYTDIFTLSYPDQDLSIKMLQMLFGKVGTALDMTQNAPVENPVISNLFRIFNLGVLTMVMLLVMYSMLFQAISVSQDGSQGMSKQSSAFLAFRIVIGSSLLLPAFNSGYNGIQVMVMNVVVYGIAFANYAWTQTYQIAMGEMVPPSITQNINQGIEYEMYPYGLANTYSTNPTPINWESTTPRCSGTDESYVTATDLFAMATCVNIAAKAVDENNFYSTDSQITAQYRNWTQIPGEDQGKCSDGDGYYVCFGNGASVETKATACGSIKFANEAQFNAITGAVSKAMDIGGMAAGQAWSGQYVETDGTLNTLGKGQYDCSDISEIGNNPDWPDSWINADNSCAVSSYISEIAELYAQGLIAMSDASDASDSSGTSDGSGDEAYKTGWATAGQYFQVLSQSLAANQVKGADTASTDLTSQAQSLLKERGTMPKYNFSPNGENVVTNDNNIVSSNGSLSNTPTCIQQVLCFDVAGAGPDNRKKLTNFYDAVLPTSKGNPTGAKTYNYWSAAASATVAEGAAQAKTSLETSSQGAADGTNESVQSQAACKLAEQIINACSSLNSDMPAYLTSSNVMSPSNLSTISSGASSTDTGANSLVAPISYQKTDFATTNMMLSVYMTLESLTGMKLFSSPVTDTSTYKSISNGVSASSSMCNTTGVQSLAKGCDGDNGSDFLWQLDSRGLLVMGRSDSNPNTTRAGLFGMVRLQDAGVNVYADPLANLTNLGVTMISSAVFYYMVTMQQLFEALLTISGFYTTYLVLAKMLAAIGNLASLGSFEPVFVSMAALVESFLQMMFALDKFALEVFLPLGSAIAGILFTQGVVLGVFLPFLATIIYLFGVLGWLFSVLEGMVASSLVAMGLTHPEGHDLLGQTEQALMLLLGVFIRPVAMILGLFFSISVSQAILNLVNTGFLFVTSDYFNTTMAAGAAGANVGATYSKVVSVASIGLLLVYTYICYSILEMCYGLISGIPDRILRWIGGPETQSQATQMAGKIKDETKGAAQQGAQGAGQTVRAPQVQPASTGISVAGATRKEEKKDDENEITS